MCQLQGTVYSKAKVKQKSKKVNYTQDSIWFFIHITLELYKTTLPSKGTDGF